MSSQEQRAPSHPKGMDGAQGIDLQDVLRAAFVCVTFCLVKCARDEFQVLLVSL